MVKVQKHDISSATRSRRLVSEIAVASAITLAAVVFFLTTRSPSGSQRMALDSPQSTPEIQPQ
jgi:hypothetical protein